MSEVKVGDIHYRYESYHLFRPPPYMDDTTWNEPDEYEVVKLTTWGHWVRPIDGLLFNEKDRFVLDSARKKRVHQTKELAFESFCIRKRCQYKIIKGQLERVTEIIKAIKQLEKGDQDERDS